MVLDGDLPRRAWFEYSVNGTLQPRVEFIEFDARSATLRLIALDDEEITQVRIRNEERGGIIRQIRDLASRAGDYHLFFDEFFEPDMEESGMRSMRAYLRRWSWYECGSFDPRCACAPVCGAHMFTHMSEYVFANAHVHTCMHQLQHACT